MGVCIIYPENNLKVIVIFDIIGDEIIDIKDHYRQFGRK